MFDALIQLVRDSFIGYRWGRHTVVVRGLVTLEVVAVIALILMLRFL